MLAVSTGALPARVERRSFGVRVWRGAEHADFHVLWLRHQHDGDRHPTTGERTVCVSDIDPDITLRSAVIEGDALVLAFSDDTESRHTLEWLFAHAYAKRRDEVDPPSSDLERVTLTRARGEILDDVVARVIPRLRRDGVVVVRRAPGDARAPESETEALIDAFERAGFGIVGTHFGRIEDLRLDNTTNANTDQLGYTDAGIDVHTDQPFIEHPPRYQILQGIRAADEGGESFIVDARQAARHLHSIDREAYERLTQTPLCFHRRQKNFESVIHAPILNGDPFSDDDGRFQVRSSYFTEAPFNVPFHDVEALYRAYTRFARIVRNRAHQVRFHLGAGDFVIYDNWRMLHGRTAFTGHRWLRGIYLQPRHSPAPLTFSSVVA
jgi:alpha-ketoglutarate-dependent taurine dioxygenase